MGWYDNKGNMYTFKVTDTKPAVSEKQQQSGRGRTGSRTKGTVSTTRTKPITQTYTVPEGIDDIKKAQ